MIPEGKTNYGIAISIPAGPILLAISGEGGNQFGKAICHLKALNVL
jgi:hypothetical protein